MTKSGAGGNTGPVAQMDNAMTHGITRAAFALFLFPAPIQTSEVR